MDKVLKDIKSALKKNTLPEDMYVYKASSEQLELNTIEYVSLNLSDELNQILKDDKIRGKIYLYKIRLPKGTNYVAFSNIIFYDNKNMTLPVGMNLSSKILVDLSELNIEDKNIKELNKLQFEDEDDDFSKIVVRNINLSELK